MINLLNGVTIFTCIYLLESFTTFNMGVSLCVYMYGCWCGSLCICTTVM